jgi:hypothetical protein
LLGLGHREATRAKDEEDRFGLSFGFPFGLSLGLPLGLSLGLPLGFPFGLSLGAAETGRPTKDFDPALVLGHENVLLEGGDALVRLELPVAIVAFRGLGEDLDEDDGV